MNPVRLNFLRTFCENTPDTLSVPITFRNLSKNCQIFVTSPRASTSAISNVYTRLLHIHLTEKRVCDTHMSIPEKGCAGIDPPLPEYSKRKQECSSALGAGGKRTRGVLLPLSLPGQGQAWFVENRLRGAPHPSVVRIFWIIQSFVGGVFNLVFFRIVRVFFFCVSSMNSV